MAPVRAPEIQTKLNVDLNEFSKLHFTWRNVSVKDHWMH